MGKGQQISVRIDKLNNSIEACLTGKRFKTEVAALTHQEMEKEQAKDWLFNWKKELMISGHRVFKLTITGKTNIQGWVSLSVETDHVYMHLLESAPHNRGRNKKYWGVPGNLVAFACLLSETYGKDGYVAFTAKTNLVEHYRVTLHAKHLANGRMYLDTYAAQCLIKQYF